MVENLETSRLGKNASRYFINIRRFYFATLLNIDFNKEISINIITNENGRAPIIIADRKVSIPPAANSEAITAVKITPHIKMCLVCFCF